MPEAPPMAPDPNDVPQPTVTAEPQAPVTPAPPPTNDEDAGNPFLEPPAIDLGALASPEPPAPEPDPVPAPQPEITPPAPQPDGSEPPPIDLAAIGADLPRLANEAANMATRQQWEQLHHRSQQIDAELNSIPHQTEDQLAALSDRDRERVNQLRMEKNNIQQQVDVVLPKEHAMRQSLMQQQAVQIASVQRRVATEHPEYASRILDIARVMPPEQQANPVVYEGILNQVIGEEARRDRDQKRMEEASQRATVAGRSGPDTHRPAREVTSQEVDVLRRLGLKPDAVKRAAGRLGEA